MIAWGLFDGTARFPDSPSIPPSPKRHRPFVGWYAGDYPICGAFCGARLGPVEVRRGVATGWRHIDDAALADKLAHRDPSDSGGTEGG